MAELKYYKVLVVFVLLLSSCDFFNTREPENPNSSDSQYLPQTSAESVISNFIKSFSERNTEYYLSTLIEKAKFPNNEFAFYPTSEALNQYPSTFDIWNLTNENQFMQMFKTKLPTSKKINLIFSNPKSDFHSDSSVYVYDYYCELDSSISPIPNKYSGIIQLVILKNQNGQWAISKWYDFKKNNDTIVNTLSILKGKLSN
jgi:hypothetical protein